MAPDIFQQLNKFLPYLSQTAGRWLALLVNIKIISGKSVKLGTQELYVVWGALLWDRQPLWLQIKERRCC